MPPGRLSDDTNILILNSLRLLHTPGPCTRPCPITVHRAKRTKGYVRPLTRITMVIIPLRLTSLSGIRPTAGLITISQRIVPCVGPRSPFLTPP